MTFRELVQSHLPVRYLGASPIGFRRPLLDGLEVIVEGCPDPVFLSNEELMQNRLICTLIDVPLLPDKR